MISVGSSSPDGVGDGAGARGAPVIRDAGAAGAIGDGAAARAVAGADCGADAAGDADTGGAVRVGGYAAAGMDAVAGAAGDTGAVPPGGCEGVAAACGTVAFAFAFEADDAPAIGRSTWRLIGRPQFGQK